MTRKRIVHELSCVKDGDGSGRMMGTIWFGERKLKFEVES